MLQSLSSPTPLQSIHPRLSLSVNPIILGSHFVGEYLNTDMGGNRSPSPSAPLQGNSGTHLLLNMVSNSRCQLKHGSGVYSRRSELGVFLTRYRLALLWWWSVFSSILRSGDFSLHSASFLLLFIVCVFERSHRVVALLQLEMWQFRLSEWRISLFCFFPSSALWTLHRSSVCPDSCPLLSILVQTPLLFLFW